MSNRNWLEEVVGILEQHKNDPCGFLRYHARNRDYVDWALASTNGVALAVSSIEAFKLVNGRLPVADADDLREYVLALAIDGLKKVYQHSGQIIAGHMMPVVTQKQVRRLAVCCPQDFRIDTDTVNAKDRARFPRERQPRKNGVMKRVRAAKA